ncbi:cadherin-23-like [Mercenaria mercenaria]|uniref:cadherin-23-like n=1 Tax=Mercenaria mercenaria TaxID=6596 RepID=UPI00234FB325|nr:cadherin-23-like [Mercenaria mercenaria]
MLTEVWIVVFLCGATLYTTDAQITGWTVPNITDAASGPGAAPITFPEDQPVGATTTSFTATPSGSDTIASYTLLTSGTPFSVNSSSGLINLDSALDFETTASYTVEVRAVDSNASSNTNTGTATVSITVTDVNEAPTFSAASLSACVADASTGGQSVTTLTATDQDTGDNITYSIDSGDTNNHFTFFGDELRVSSGITLNMSATANYTLVIHAVDDDLLTGNATLTVTVGDCNSATALAISIMMSLMALVVSLY